VFDYTATALKRLAKNILDGHAITVVVAIALERELPRVLTVPDEGQQRRVRAS